MRTNWIINASFLSLTAALASAGDLNPPAGPVGPTMKPLSEVEPRVAINATNTPGDADSLFKITQRGSYYLTGNITGVSGKHGIEIVVSGVSLDLNGFDLAGVPGMGAFDGVSATVSSLANIAVVNGSVRNWGGEGIDLGTFLGTTGRVEHVLASGNAGFGIFVGSGSTVANCSAFDNSGAGILCNAGSTIIGCTANDNSGEGISVAPGTIVADCIARSNTLEGIRCMGGCVIRNNACTANGNGGDGAGIHVTGVDSRVEGNNCSGADRGIEVDGSSNRIDGNSCQGNAVGFDIAGADNLVIRNTATGGSPNYLIGAGNSVAPRVSVANSDGWAGIANANHPWANLGY